MHCCIRTHLLHVRVGCADAGGQGKGPEVVLRFAEIYLYIYIYIFCHEGVPGRTTEKSPILPMRMDLSLFCYFASLLIFQYLSHNPMRHEYYLTRTTSAASYFVPWRADLVICSRQEIFSSLNLFS